MWTLCSSHNKTGWWCYYEAAGHGGPASLSSWQSVRTCDMWVWHRGTDLLLVFHLFACWSLWRAGGDVPLVFLFTQRRHLDMMQVNTRLFSSTEHVETRLFSLISHTVITWKAARTEPQRTTTRAPSSVRLRGASVSSLFQRTAAEAFLMCRCFTRLHFQLRIGFHASWVLRGWRCLHYGDYWVGGVGLNAGISMKYR